VRCAILNAAWYGVPQARERVFIMGIRDDLHTTPTFPMPTRHLPKRRGHLAGDSLRCATFARDDFLVRVAPSINSSPAVTSSQALGDLPSIAGRLRTSPSVRRGSNPRPLPYRRGRPSEYASLMQLAQ
jgi:DNA (cytosine-5)-methyltransferase 1